ncbi:unnamed protein product [Aureobasidium pullulans]|nr:unnamed protein product [Aureobasidium pullulans]
MKFALALCAITAVAAVPMPEAGLGSGLGGALSGIGQGTGSGVSGVGQGAGSGFRAWARGW